MLPLLSQPAFPDTSNLRDEVLSEFRVPDHSTGHVRRKEGDVSLYLMKHGLCIGQLYLVLHAGALVASNYTVNFFMNFGCKDMNHECYSRDVSPGHLEMLTMYNRKWPRKGSQGQRHVVKQPTGLLLNGISIFYFLV